MTVASVLGVGAHRVVVKVKRMGGGFGGKESRFGLFTLTFSLFWINLVSWVFFYFHFLLTCRSVPLTAAVAVAAKATGRPVRLMLDRDEEMITSGWRHPFLGRYKVAFSSDVDDDLWTAPYKVISRRTLMI